MEHQVTKRYTPIFVHEKQITLINPKPDESLLDQCIDRDFPTLLYDQFGPVTLGTEPIYAMLISPQPTPTPAAQVFPAILLASAQELDAMSVRWNPEDLTYHFDGEGPAVACATQCEFWTTLLPVDWKDNTGIQVTARTEGRKFTITFASTAILAPIPPEAFWIQLQCWRPDTC